MNNSMVEQEVPNKTIKKKPERPSSAVQIQKNLEERKIVEPQFDIEQKKHPNRSQHNPR